MAFWVNHKRVQRIMNQLGLFGKRPKEKYHSYKGDVGKVADNIINRDFSTEKPLQKWTTDVSQFNLSWGKCYISPILDMNTNEIISYNLLPVRTWNKSRICYSRHLNAFLCAGSGHALRSGLAISARILPERTSKAWNYSIYVPKGQLL